MRIARNKSGLMMYLGTMPKVSAASSFSQDSPAGDELKRFKCRFTLCSALYRVTFPSVLAAARKLKHTTAKS